MSRAWNAHFELRWIKRYEVLADEVNILILLRKKETFERALMMVEDDFVEMAESSYHHSLGFGILIVACWLTTDWVAVLVCYNHLYQLYELSC